MGGLVAVWRQDVKMSALARFDPHPPVIIQTHFRGIYEIFVVILAFAESVL
jgi:hypothetical protein